MITVPDRSATLPVTAEAVTVGEVMTRGVIGCAPETPLRTVAKLMAKHGVHAIFVFEHIDEDDEAQQLWAVVSDLDLVAAAGRDLDTVTAGAAAVTPLVTIAADCPLGEAGSLMAQHGIAHLAVTEPASRTPVGVISTLDVARAVGVGAGSSMSTAPRPGSVRPKEFHFPLAVKWCGGRRVSALVEGKAPIEISPPPVFRGTSPETWSPEDFLVAASAACLAVTFTGVAERASLTYTDLAVEADGICSMRPDGRFGFTGLRLRLNIETAPAEVERARVLAAEAETTCLVSASLDLPVETEVVVKSTSSV